MIQLSVVIATYNRGGPLRRCLEALCQQTQAVTDFQVIVVVDGSTDGTQQMLAGLHTPYSLSVIWQPNGGPGAARNRGAEAAVGRYCLFLDDDIIADPGLVAEHIRQQHGHQGIVGLGHLTCRLPRRPDGFARYIAQWWTGHYARLRDGRRTPTFMDCFSGNLSVPREAFLQVGGFARDLAASEDVELGYRLAREHLSFVYIPQAVGHQEYGKGFQEIAAGIKRAGAVSIELYRRHPGMLAHMPLGAFSDMGPGSILLCRLLLALGGPIRPLALVGLPLSRPTWEHQWYRFLYRYCYWHGVRRTVADADTWQRLTRGTLILLYHAFGHPREPASRFVVPAHCFARQMAWLARWRYRVLSLDELLQYRQEYQLPPARSVVITADDGYEDIWSRAYPILHRHRFPATLFLVSGAVGATNTWDREGTLAGRPLLAWPEIDEMARGRIRYGAHTRTHPHLTMLHIEEMEHEVLGSRQDLEKHLGWSIQSFAYPYGQHNETAETVAARAGFQAACGIREGMNGATTASHALRRTEVYGTDSLLRFVLLLCFGHRRLLSRLWRG